MLFPKPKHKKRIHVDIYKDIILKLDDYRCVHCGSADIDNPHHIIFRSQGGSDEPSNRITLCRICHKKVHGTIKVEGITGDEFMMMILDKLKCTIGFRWDESYYELDKRIALKEVGCVETTAN